MTSAQVTAFVTLVLAIIALFVLVIRGVPQIARLLFLRRIEVIRDECMDAVLDGRLRETRSVGRFLKAIDVGADIAPHVTLARMFAVARAMVDTGRDTGSMARSPRFSDLSPAEREFMHTLDERLYRAYISYLTWGSPAALVLKPYLVLAGRFRRGGRIVKAEDAMPAVARETLRAGTAQDILLWRPRISMAARHPRSAG